MILVAGMLPAFCSSPMVALPGDAPAAGQGLAAGPRPRPGPGNLKSKLLSCQTGAAVCTAGPQAQLTDLPVRTCYLEHPNLNMAASELAHAPVGPPEAAWAVYYTEQAHMAPGRGPTGSAQQKAQ